VRRVLRITDAMSKRTQLLIAACWLVAINVANYLGDFYSTGLYN